MSSIIATIGRYNKVLIQDESDWVVSLIDHSNNYLSYFALIKVLYL